MIILIIVGVINLYSASHSGVEMKGRPVYLKQLLLVGVGFLFLFAVLWFDYHLLLSLAYPSWGFSILLLIAVLFIGKTVSGSQRWLPLGLFSFQPSELAKLSLVLALAKYFHSQEIKGRYGFRELLPPFGLALIPALLIMKQPDLGTAVLILLICVTIFFFVGVTWKTMLGTSAALAFFLPLSWFFLKDYQKKRVLVFLQPETDPLGAGYHILQSKIAVGSGGIWGKGFLKGTQGQLRFLPEHHTDFAFSLLAEEWGFLGSLLVVTLFLLLVLWALNIARQAKDRFGLVTAFGIGAFFFLA